jgi:hypothetical protein
VFEHTRAMMAALGKLAQAAIKEAAAPRSKAESRAPDRTDCELSVSFCSVALAQI